MEETYFVIRNSDGDTFVHQLTKEQLLRNLNYGEYRDAFKKLPAESDTNYWGEGVLIIKGTVVAPRAEEVITKYDID